MAMTKKMMSGGMGMKKMSGSMGMSGGTKPAAMAGRGPSIKSPLSTNIPVNHPSQGSHGQLKGTGSKY